MNIVIYLLSSVFLLLAAALLFTWWHRRHPGALLLAATYALAAALAIAFTEWLPLAAGFLSAWALRLMGMDPGPAAPRNKPQPPSGP